MKNKDGCLTIVVYAVLTVIAIIVGKWFFEAVMATDWPDWVKFMILVR